MMKRDKIIAMAVIALIFAFCFSCANTTTPPMGGIKDTIPPLLLKVSPDSGRVNFPLKEGSVELKFNEYVVLSEPLKNIYLSPPQSRSPETKIRGKSIIVSFPSILDSATTYTLNFGRSIADNNEGNLFGSYVYPFSTGSSIDSLMCSGTIVNSQSLLPVSNATIAFYKDHSDSSLLNSLPSAIAKSDKFGYFLVRNIGNIPYRVFAFTDNNNNNKYDPEGEEVAFLDTLLTPAIIMRADLKELIQVDEKDTLTAMSRPSELNLYLFKEDPAKQFIREAKRLQHRMAYVKFSTPEAEVLSVKYKGIDSTSLLKEFNIRRDSLVIWINDTSIVVSDTLNLEVKYMKTDSLNNLTPFTEDFRLVYTRPKRDTQREMRNRSETGIKEKRADLLEFEMKADATLFETEGIKLTFPSPIVHFLRDSLKLEYKAPRGEVGTMKYTVVKDSIYSRIMSIMPTERILPGYEYTLRAPTATFKDIYKQTNDSTFVTVKLPNDDALSKLILDIKGADGSYIIDLTNITRDKVFRSYKINKDSRLEFPYLQKGEYSIRITQDINGNGIIDTGNVLLKKQPEKVRLYSLSDGVTIITIPESVELLQSVDLKSIFN
ncbi:MAG TPA: hypothetical protein DF637_05370 [Rikenellaceae bacterium]|nr:hypothetical protein [Rikenellaceae bacterium]